MVMRSAHGRSRIGPTGVDAAGPTRLRGRMNKGRAQIVPLFMQDLARMCAEKWQDMERILPLFPMNPARICAGLCHTGPRIPLSPVRGIAIFSASCRRPVGRVRRSPRQGERVVFFRLYLSGARIQKCGEELCPGISAAGSILRALQRCHRRGGRSQDLGGLCGDFHTQLRASNRVLSPRRRSGWRNGEGVKARASCTCQKRGRSTIG